MLDLVVVEHLYDNGMAEEHGHDEGVLTMLKQSVVSNKSLALIGLHLGLHHLILMDCKEIDHVMNEFEHIRVNLDLYMRNSVRIAELKLDALKLLSDVFEALVGAIFIDNDFNYNSSRDVVLGVMGNFIQRFTSSDFVTTSPIKLFKDFLDRNQYRRWSVEKDASI